MGAKRGVGFWDRWVGPVLLFDLLRLTRRGSTTIFWTRSIYVGFLLLAILIFGVIELGLKTPEQFLDGVRTGFSVPASKAASFASHFFFVLLGVELAMVVLLTPAYIGGAIAEDRERRIIDDLLVSDLSNREIILGKLLSRLAHLVLLLLTGLPPLVVAQVLGGVHPVFLLTGFIAALMTMASLGAVSIYESIFNSRADQAIFHIYYVLGVFLMLSIVTILALITGYSPTAWITERAGFICASINPLFPIIRLAHEMGRKDWPNRVLVESLTDFTLIHGLLFVGCLVLAINQLRSYLTSSPLSRVLHLGLRLQKHRAGLSEETGRRLAALARPQHPPTESRPSLKSQPILWKELHVASTSLRFSQEMRTVVDAVVRIMTIISGSIFPLLLLKKIFRGRSFNALWDEVLFISTVLIVLLLTGTAVRAASCLSGERERNTLDGLLATALENAAIINGKWLASLLKMRLGWIMLTVVWGASALLGVFDWRALPLLVLAAVSWACFAASLGVFCSLLCRTTWRATVLTLGLLLAMGAFPWLLGWSELTPVGMLDALIVPTREENLLRGGVLSAEGKPVLSGILVYSILAMLLWGGTHFFFPHFTGRMLSERKGGRASCARAESR